MRTRRRRPSPMVAVLALGAIAAACSYTTELKLPKADAESTKVFAADGSLLATLHAAVNREDVKLAAVSLRLQDAVIAIEDSRFFEHEGVDARAVVRALTRDVRTGEAAEGGSTITQQYVRNVLLERDKTVSRKLREAVLAVQLERKYSKKQILERYLNVVYFGNGAYGVQAASRLYFGRDARDLDLAQSALLAGVIQRPERVNPFRDAAASTRRRSVVLDRMVALHKATAAEVAAAKTTPVPVAPATPPDRYPAGHFVERVKQFVLGDPRFGETPEARQRLLLQGGLRIETTLDPTSQVLAQSAIAKVLDEPVSDPEAGLVAIDPATGYVKAYVGGRDFFGTGRVAKFDLAGQGLRQAGSSFKPFVLTAALQAEIPLDRQYDAPKAIDIPIKGQPSWSVKNYDADEGGGRMDLIEATVHSINTVYAQLVMDVGPQKVVDLAAQMGVRSKLLPFPSAALGTNGVTVLDMASAYGTLAADGLHADPVFVTKVTRRDGTILYQAAPQRQRVISQTVSRQVTQVLQQVVNRGTAINARIGRPVAGKTGTAEEWHDAWFVGYVPQLVTAVWVGFPEVERSMVPPTTRIRVTGGTWPAQIWQQFTASALAQTASADFPEPEVPNPTTTTAPVPTVPPVVGLSLADATRSITNAGYELRVESTPSRERPAGTVVDQLPVGSTPAQPGSTVLLTVSDGPPKTVVVPSVLGLYADQAANALRAVGLTVQLTSEAEPPPGDPARRGRVWRQAPLAGAEVSQGTTVTITLNPE